MSSSPGPRIMRTLSAFESLWDCWNLTFNFFLFYLGWIMKSVLRLRRRETNTKQLRQRSTKWSYNWRRHWPVIWSGRVQKDKWYSDRSMYDSAGKDQMNTQSSLKNQRWVECPSCKNSFLHSWITRDPATHLMTLGPNEEIMCLTHNLFPENRNHKSHTCHEMSLEYFRGKPIG